NRVAESQAVANRIVIDSVVNDPIFRQILKEVLPQLQRNPNPIIYKVENPADATNSSSLREFNVNTSSLPSDRIPDIFIYGILNNGKEDAWTFYNNFNNAIGMFNAANAHAFSNVDIYIVAYDTRIEFADVGFSDGVSNTQRVIIPPTSPILPVLMWREWERRATITANQAVFPFLKKMSDSNIKGRAIAHSLGNFVLASAAQRLVAKSSNSLNQPLLSWFAVAPAIPSNAFSVTGIFEDAPFITDDNTSVFFSRNDAALSGPYVIANGHQAMGQTGALNSSAFVVNVDVTLCLGTTLHEAKWYFNAMAPIVRRILGIDSSNIPSCAVINPPVF
ncbi:alpha/beta hydrolase, partial [Priestia megaterium]|uniref:alpha/beta hydrolase n=1 Tax=Priestia megaterium TaxID=1404 RepID=UPI00300086E9